MKTVIIGASENTTRYANRAAHSLLQNGHVVELIGLKKGQIQGHPIQTGLPPLTDVDTVTMYVGVGNQAGYVDYVMALKPRRVIFNPGAENPELARQLRQEGIEAIDGCTLVMLSIGTY